MEIDIQQELCKFKVPLSQAWEEAQTNLLAHHDRIEVEKLTMLEAENLEKLLTGNDEYKLTDSVLFERSKEAALAFVQTKFSGSLPALPEREADALSQHGSIWSLIGKMLQSSSSDSALRSWALTFGRSVLDGSLGEANWKRRARDTLVALASLKGLVDERIVDLCLMDKFLCERDLVIPSVKLVVRSKKFKKLMSAPDMITDGEKTLPKLLLSLASDKEFRQVFVWLPLDPSSPLNQSGGSGVIPTDKEDYRFVVKIIMKILFGKLRQRGQGIDKRSNFVERQNQIMGYVGTIPVEEIGIVFEILFGRFAKNFSSQVRWSECEFVDSDNGATVFNKEFIQANPTITMGTLQLMSHIVTQMKRKVDAFVPLMTGFVVSILAWTGLPSDEDIKSKSVNKICLQRISELMTAYSELYPNGTVWETLLSPVVDILDFHLSRSSAAELSTAFKIVTSWSIHENLVRLYTTGMGQKLLKTLFTPRALSGGPVNALFGMVLTLCGIDDSDDAKTTTYQQSKRQLLREHKRTGGEDMDSDLEDNMDDTEKCLPALSVVDAEMLRLVTENINSIVAITALSLGGDNNPLVLRVTVAIAQLAYERSIALPEDSCGKLLVLLGDLIAPTVMPRKGSSTRKARSQNTAILFQAISSLVKNVDGSLLPATLLQAVAKPVVSLDDLRGRVLLSDCILEISKKTTPEDVKAVEILVALNSLKNSASLQPDVDRHVDILQDILESDELEYYLASSHLLRHCLFLLGSDGIDSTVRHCAERFVSLIGKLVDESGTLPMNRLLMVLNALHRMLDSHSSEGPHRSALKVLVFYVKEYARKVPETDSESARLLHKDLLPFTVSPTTGSGDSIIVAPSVMEDLLHIQKARRSNALSKLGDKADQLTEYTKTKILIPLSVEGIIQPGTAKANYDNGQMEICIKVLRKCSKVIEVLTTFIKVHLRKFPEREKVIFRTISKLVEHIRLVDERELSETEMSQVKKSLIPNLRKRVWDARGAVKAGYIGQQQERSHKLARDKRDSADDGLVKIDVVVALLEVMKLLPESEFDAGMPQVVRIVLQGLPSRELENRKAAREALRRCGKAMGVAKTAWLMKEVRQAVPRDGYQAAVAVFTCFAIVEAVLDQGLVVDKPTSLAIAEEGLELLRIEDRQWAMIQSRADGQDATVDDIPNQCIEAKRQKAHELLELCCKHLVPEVSTGVVLRAVYSLLNSLDGVEIDIDTEDEQVDLNDASSDSSSEDEGKKPAKRKLKQTSKKDTQLNSVYGKKYFARIEAAVNSCVGGLLGSTLYSAEQRLGVAIQSFAHFDDIVSRKFKMNDSGIFLKNDFSADLLEVDDILTPTQTSGVKKQKVSDLRHRQKEATYLVQPGASTGKGHWVTEEWKRGKINDKVKSKKFGGIDLRAVKAKVLGNVGLRVLASVDLIADFATETSLRTAVGKFVTRCFVSGIGELFQASAKAIQRLVTDGETFNGKAMTIIAKKLISFMEQLHSSGSDLSFITLKTQRKHAQSEIASTCSSLLLALVSRDKSEEWMKQDMLDALASHVRASLDKPSLQLAALAILRKILVSKKFKSATVYDCLNTVGELVVTASNPKICGLCGVLYGQFLVDFPHTEKALMSKVLTLLKQAQTASSAVSRCAALNTVYSFVKALPAKTLQDQFAEITVVTLAVGASSEDDTTALGMIKTIIAMIISRYVDQTKRDRLVSVIREWPTRMTKHQFLLGSASVISMLAADNQVPATDAVQVIISVVRQLPYLVDVAGNDVQTAKAHLAIIHATESLVVVDRIESVCDMDRVIQFTASHLLKAEDVSPAVVAQGLRLVNMISQTENGLKLLPELREGLEVFDNQQIDSIAPWPLLMRVLRVLTRDTTETHLEIASLAMKAIAALLPLTANCAFAKNEASSSPKEISTSESEDEVEVKKSDLGLFAKKTVSVEDESLPTAPAKTADASERLSALLKKLRFEVRGLMKTPRECIIRLASLLKLCTALTLSAPAEEHEKILGTCLEVLVRLATINKTAEEVSTEIGEVNSLFDLSRLRPIEQIGCLSKMANAAIESLEKHYRSIPSFFTKQLTKVTTAINKSRKDRKISLMNLAISNPARLAQLRLQKSKKKSERKQIKQKESVKRIKGMIH